MYTIILTYKCSYVYLYVPMYMYVYTSIPICMYMYVYIHIYVPNMGMIVPNMSMTSSTILILAQYPQYEPVYTHMSSPIHTQYNVLKHKIVSYYSV